jgi:hypothetical protein
MIAGDNHKRVVEHSAGFKFLEHAVKVPIGVLHFERIIQEIMAARFRRRASTRGLGQFHPAFVLPC